MKKQQQQPKQCLPFRRLTPEESAPVLTIKTDPFLSNTINGLLFDNIEDLKEAVNYIVSAQLTDFPQIILNGQPIEIPAIFANVYPGYRRMVLANWIYCLSIGNNPGLLLDLIARDDTILNGPLKSQRKTVDPEGFGPAVEYFGNNISDLYGIGHDIDENINF